MVAYIVILVACLVSSGLADPLCPDGDVCVAETDKVFLLQTDIALMESSAAKTTQKHRESSAAKATQKHQDTYDPYGDNSGVKKISEVEKTALVARNLLRMDKDGSRGERACAPNRHKCFVDDPDARNCLEEVVAYGLIDTEKAYQSRSMEDEVQISVAFRRTYFGVLWALTPEELHNKGIWGCNVAAVCEKKKKVRGLER